MSPESDLAELIWTKWGKSDLVLSHSESETKEHLFREEVVGRFDGPTSSQSLIPDRSPPSTSIGVEVP